MIIGHGFLCGPKVYEYKGVAFEVNSYLGPWPLKKNGDPKERAGRKFYAFIREFEKLPREERETYRIGGGCRKVTF